MNGVSLTYGAAGSRQHIWSFVAAVYETSNTYATQATCECTNTNYNRPHQVASFIGNNYLCDSGNPGPGDEVSATYLDDPLWDGTGCGQDSTCCQQLNNAPWFCTSLPQPTSDDWSLESAVMNLMTMKILISIWLKYMWPHDSNISCSLVIKNL